MDKPYVLCAEDSNTDIALMQRVFDLSLKEFDCIFRTNVNEAIHFLEEAYHSEHLPFLILLDIKLVNSNGLDLLKFIKEDIRFKKTPAVMLSSSDRIDDKTRAKHLGCNEYHEKPKSYTAFKETIPKIVLDWNKVTSL